MSTNFKTISLFPWVGGITDYGNPTTKPSAGLQECENWVFDFDGTKRRRGGQEHLHRTPVREGNVFAEHFMDTDSIKWDLKVGSANTWDWDKSSILRVAGSANEYLSTSLQTEGGASPFKELVEALTADDPSANASETLVQQITWRTKFTALPATGATNGWQFWVDGGQPGGGAEWIFGIRFADSGIYLSNVAEGWELINAVAGTTSVLSADSTDFIDADWHEWRADITLSGSDYLCSLYLHEKLIYSGSKINKASSATAPKVEVRWLGGASNEAIDVTIDYLELEAGIEKIRGIGDYRSAPSSAGVSSQQTIFSAGSRVYTFGSDPFYIKCIYEDLVKDSGVDVKVYNDKVIFASSAPHERPRRWTSEFAEAEELSTAPKVSMLQVHSNFLWGAGDYEFPSRLYWSSLRNETEWNTEANPGTFESDAAGWVDIEPDDGQSITGIGPSYMGNLIVYKDRGIYRVTGYSASTFAMTSISRSIGCNAHQSIRNVANDQFFASQFGVHSLVTTQNYGDIESAFLSRDIRSFWNREVNTVRLNQSWAVNNETLDRYELLVPVVDTSTDGESLTRVLTLHYGTRSEQFPTGVWSTKKISGGSMMMVWLLGDPRPKSVVGGADGFLNLQDTSNSFDFPVWAV